MSNTYRVPIFLALLALTVCMGSLQAGALTASPSTGITVTCNTANGPAAPVTVTIKLSAAYAAGTTITATPATGALTMVTPTTVLKALTDSAVFSFSVAPGCVGAATPQTITFSTTVAGATSGSTSVAVPVTITVTSTVSGLSTPSNSVTVTCVKNSASSYTAGVPQALALTSTATGGTPFTVGSSPALPDWLTVTPSSGTATAAKYLTDIHPGRNLGGLLPAEAWRQRVPPVSQ